VEVRGRLVENLFMPANLSAGSIRAPRSDPTGPAPELIWPDCLIPPTRPPALVYLDLNHLIQLAKANTGHPDGSRYVALLAAARVAVGQGAAKFVISGSLFMESGKIGSRRQRHDVADVIEELTGFSTLISRSTVMRLEVQAAIEHFIGTGANRILPVDLVGPYLVQGVGMRGGVTIKDDRGRDVSADIREAMGADEYDAMKAKMDRYMNRALLRGPEDHELEDLRRRGYAPKEILKVMQKRLDQELDLVAILDRDPRWRRGRLRDVVAGRECANELLDMIIMDLIPRGLTFGDLIAGEDEQTTIRKFVRGMPSVEVAIEIKTSYHRNPQKRWLINDIFDIDALAVAVPYCDIVFTDAAAREPLVSAQLDRRMSTLLPRRPDDLVDILTRINQQG
jgi:hypothetical protein